MRNSLFINNKGNEDGNVMTTSESEVNADKYNIFGFKGDSGVSGFTPGWLHTWYQRSGAQCSYFRFNFR